MIQRIIILLILNFGALAIGGIFTGKGVPSEWYTELNKAPWTPPGWMFGFAWTLIMICFSVYLAYLWPNIENKGFLIGLFVIQWLLNVAWNPVFFYFHKTLFALIIISALTLLIAFLLINYWSALQLKSILILPYLIWLIIATSLNWYVVVRN